MSAVSSKIEMLQDRALHMQQARSFFMQRGVLEVDTPILGKKAPVDEHIDIMAVALGEGKEGYLHSSPEYAMKRLLSLGVGDIFQISHVFRQNEHSPLHNPEFTMVEWYRMGMAFDAFIEETVAFVQIFLPGMAWRCISYKEAFLRFAHIDPMQASVEDLLEVAKQCGLSLSENIEKEKDTLLHLLMGFVIEPHLGKNELIILTDYPPSQAALACLGKKGKDIVAKRFEIYFQGIELANGYLELTDATQQRQRLEEANTKRREKGKNVLPIDDAFIAALHAGFPKCCGVAVGFDRLLLLKRGVKDLQEVLPFGWDEL